MNGVTVKEMSKAGLLGVSVDNVKRFEQVLTGNDVMVFGYPTSLGLQQLPKLDIHHSLLRKGVVVLEIDREPFQTHLNIIGVISQFVPL
jgi:hypothetical protein